MILVSAYLIRRLVMDNFMIKSCKENKTKKLIKKKKSTRAHFW